MTKAIAEFAVCAMFPFAKISGWHFHVKPYSGDLGEGLDLGEYIITENIAGTLDVYRIDLAPSAIPDLKREHLIGYGCSPKAAAARIALHKLDLWEED